MINCIICDTSELHPHCELCNKHHVADIPCNNQVTPSNSVLTASNVIDHIARFEHTIDEMRCEDGTPDLSQIESHINMLKRRMELIRLELMTTQSRRNKCIQLKDSDTVEQLRQDNPSRAQVREVRAEKRILNMYEKAVMQWKKMNFKPEKIKKLMMDVYEKDVTLEFIQGVE